MMAQKSVSTTRRIKVLLAKPGLDGHDQGAKVVVRALMDAGFEVIYTGLRQTPAQIAAAARDEGVDVVGLSSLAGSHMPFCRRLAELIREHDMTDNVWMVGGNIPAHDHAALKAMGVHAIFPTSSKLSDIVAFIRERVKP